MLKFVILSILLRYACSILVDELYDIHYTNRSSQMPTVRIKLVADIVDALEGDNIVITGHASDFEDFPSIERGVAKLETNKVTNKTLEHHKSCLRDKNQCFYIVLPS